MLINSMTDLSQCSVALHGEMYNNTILLILVLEDMHRLHKVVFISPNHCHRLGIIHSIQSNFSISNIFYSLLHSEQQENRQDEAVRKEMGLNGLIRNRENMKKVKFGILI